MKFYLKNIDADRDELIQQLSKIKVNVFTCKADTFTFLENEIIFNEVQKIVSYFSKKGKTIILTKE